MSNYHDQDRPMTPPSATRSHRYTSSSEDSYGRVHSMSRSESGTSETHYDEPTPTPPRKALIDSYTRKEAVLQRSDIPTAQQPANFDSIDPVVMHLLVETAVDDSESCQILTMEELEQLKKEQTTITRRIASLKRKLFMENKVRSTTYSLNRLDSIHGRRESMDRARHSRGVNGARGSLGADGISNNERELAASNARCDEIAQELWRMERRQAVVRDTILQHNAGILRLHHHEQSQKTASKTFDDDDSDLELADTADGILDIIGPGPLDRDMQIKLRGANSMLYDILLNPPKGNPSQYPAPPQDDASVTADLLYLEESLSTVQTLHQELSKYLQDTQAREKANESRLQNTDAILSGLWDIIGSGEEDYRQKKQELRQLTSGNPDRGMDDILSDDDDEQPDEQKYSIQAFSSKVQRLSYRVTNLSEAQVALHDRLNRHQEHDSGRTAERSNFAQQLQEAHDTHLVSRRELQDSQSQLMDARSQLSQMNQEISFIKQQRESELSEETTRKASEDGLTSQLAARAAQIASLEQLVASHTAELESTRSAHRDAESSLAKATSQADHLEHERGDLEAEVVRLQTELTVARAELDGAYGTRAQRAAEGAGNQGIKKELENETQRREEVESKLSSLQIELREMVSEYEGLVKQGVETERERDSLENSVDSLREKIEQLETKLSDEKVRTLGLRSGSSGQGEPVNGINARDVSASASGESNRGVDAASVGAMRSEFKKMVREARAEHYRALKAEQEERRRLESVIRSLRREQGSSAQGYNSGAASPATLSPLAKKSGLSHSVTAS